MCAASTEITGCMYDSTQSVCAGHANICQIHLLLSTTHSTVDCGFFLPFIEEWNHNSNTFSVC